MSVIASSTPTEVRGWLLRQVLPPAALEHLDSGMPEAYVEALYPLPFFKTQQRLLALVATDGNHTGMSTVDLGQWFRDAWDTRQFTDDMFWNIRSRQPVQLVHAWMVDQAFSHNPVTFSDDDYNRLRLMLRALTVWVVDQGYFPTSREEQNLTAAGSLWWDFSKAGQDLRTA